MVTTANTIRNATAAILWEKQAATTMNMHPAMAANGATIRLKNGRSFSFIILKKIGIYRAYVATMGSSDESKLKNPNQGAVRLAP